MSEEENTEPDCYCEERKKYPESYRDIPEGFCGMCDICGEPGHMRAHPNLPITGAWCDEHWNDLLSGRSFGLLELIGYGISILVFGGIILYMGMKLFSS